MKNQNRKIPKIRFNRFNSVWEEDRIADIVKISAGGDVDKVKLKESGKYPVIANALTNKGIVGFYEDYKVKAPAVTVTGRGDVGYAVARHENFTPIVRLLTLQSEKIDVDYLENQINSMRILNESTGVPQLTAPQLGNYKVYHPKIEEQSAIGSLFRTLDDLLVSYKDNLANYQSLKMTMLSKMFPKVGQTVPEIRLDGFEDEWEKGTIGEFGSFYYGKSAPKWSVTDEATTPCVRYGELYTKFSTKIDKIYSYTSIPKENLKLSSGNEVLVPRVGENPLDFANCSWLSLKGVAIGEMISVYNTPNNPLFIAYYFNAKMKKEFAKRVEGGSVANLYYTYLENISISVPSLPEQQAIGTYFSNLDNLINSHQEKISQLETLKKKLLQDMFI
ncbi:MULTISPECIES: restriction endonuclease subunit S [unclassified Streptococcus]|uniref:restriction endonuclease subunit S n=1 Tax=unclassified Streptococcus TaxID=2608887 RepID=UPI0020C8FFE8|nr:MULTISPECIES: restriction endonuclease subunit S [unclassified Streptococcus]MCP9060123.1 restriction endonuclease subunit S [Streptococcus sp. CF7_Ac1-12]MCP9084710.1 restriction endonuclease subunit S [Streptococcus sp. CF7_Ac1-8]